jgi:hypothetical protein
VDAGGGVATTSRAVLALAFVAGNLAESGLMAVGAVPRKLLAGVALTPLLLGFTILVPAHALLGGAFGGAVLVVLVLNAMIYAGAFAQDAALVVDELVLSSQTLALCCVLLTLLMPNGWDWSALSKTAGAYPWAAALLAAGVAWSVVYAALRPRVPALGAALTSQWVALCVVAGCAAALKASDFDCFWAGEALPETLLHSFAAGMASFYLAFHAFLFLIPFGSLVSGGDAQKRRDMDEFYAGIARKLVARGTPVWLLTACLALEAGTWALIYLKRMVPPPAVMLFVVLGFAHVFLIELKRFVATRHRRP